MKTRLLYFLAPVVVPAGMILSGCYTQMATTDEDNGEGDAETSYVDSDTTQDNGTTVINNYYGDDAYRSWRMRLSFQYYSDYAWTDWYNPWNDGWTPSYYGHRWQYGYGLWPAWGYYPSPLLVYPYPWWYYASPAFGYGGYYAYGSYYPGNGNGLPEHRRTDGDTRGSGGGSGGRGPVAGGGAVAPTPVSASAVRPSSPPAAVDRASERPTIIGPVTRSRAAVDPETPPTGTPTTGSVRPTKPTAAVDGNQPEPKAVTPPARKPAKIDDTPWWERVKTDNPPPKSVAPARGKAAVDGGKSGNTGGTVNQRPTRTNGGAVQQQPRRATPPRPANGGAKEPAPRRVQAPPRAQEPRSQPAPPPRYEAPRSAPPARNDGGRQGGNESSGRKPSAR